MKSSIFIFLLLLLGVQLPAEAQILEKFAKKVAKDIVEELSEKKERPKEQEKGSKTGNVSLEETPEKISTSFETEGKGNAFEGATETISLGKVGSFVQLSPDGGHIAHLGFDGSRQVLFLDGLPGPAFDEIKAKMFFKFSNNGGHSIYVGKKNGKCILVIDGEAKEELACDNFSLFRTFRTLAYNENGDVLAYERNAEGGGKEVVINGVPGPKVVSVQEKTFAVRGKDVYYIADKFQNKHNKGSFLFINNKLLDIPVYPETFRVSNDGKNYAFISRNPETYQFSVVLNGKQLPETYQNPPALNLEPESGAITLEGYFQGKYWKGEAGAAAPKDRLLSNKVAYHPPTGKMAYYLLESGGYRVWNDGKTGPYFENVTDLQFTGDGQRLLYIAHSGGRYFVVVDETEYGPYAKVSDLQVSERGGAYTYLATEGGVTNRYLNSKNLGNQGVTKNFQFSPDGSRYAFSVDREPFFTIDGKRLSPSDFRKIEHFAGEYDIRYPDFVFGPKNRVAYTYSRVKNMDRQGIIVLGEKELVRKLEHPSFGYPSFSPDGSHFVHLSQVRNDDDINDWQLYIDLKPGPVVGEMKGVNNSDRKIGLKFLDNNTVQVIGFMDKEILVTKVRL